MVRLSVLAVVVGLGQAAAVTSARATFGCTVGPTSEGHAILYARPDRSSAVIRKVRDGAMVSLLDNVAAPSKAWSAVAHATDGNLWHGAGDRGWMLARDLKDCG